MNEPFPAFDRANVASIEFKPAFGATRLRLIGLDGSILADHTTDRPVTVNPDGTLGFHLPDA